MLEFQPGKGHPKIREPKSLDSQEWSLNPCFPSRKVYPKIIRPQNPWTPAKKGVSQNKGAQILEFQPGQGYPKTPRSLLALQIPNPSFGSISMGIKSRIKVLPGGSFPTLSRISCDNNSQPFHEVHADSGAESQLLHEGRGRDGHGHGAGICRENSR